MKNLEITGKLEEVMTTFNTLLRTNSELNELYTQSLLEEVNSPEVVESLIAASEKKIKQGEASFAMISANKLYENLEWYHELNKTLRGAWKGLVPEEKNSYRTRGYLFSKPELLVEDGKFYIIGDRAVVFYRGSENYCETVAFQPEGYKTQIKPTVLPFTEDYFIKRHLLEEGFDERTIYAGLKFDRDSLLPPHTSHPYGEKFGNRVMLLPDIEANQKTELAVTCTT